MSKYQHVARAVFGQPWMVRPETLDTIVALVRLRADGGRLTDAEIRARVDGAAAAAGPRRGARTMGSVGVIPIYGILIPRASLMSDMSGGTAVADVRVAFRQALDDEAIGSILLDIDSPGGMVDGIDELATEIREARGRKPIVAIADYTMASAAYYLGSAADEVVASPSAMVGWIGTVMAHTEFSKADEMAGVTTTVIRNPPGKAGANEFEPLSEQARAELQQTVDDFSAQFHAAVAKGRGVPVATVKSDFGQGGGMTAARAKAAGLVDRVETFDATVRRLATGRGPMSRRAGAMDLLRWRAGTGESMTPIEVDGDDFGQLGVGGPDDEPMPALEANQGGDPEPADDPDAGASGEVGTPPVDEAPREEPEGSETLEQRALIHSKHRHETRVGGSPQSPPTRR